MPSRSTTSTTKRSTAEPRSRRVPTHVAKAAKAAQRRAPLSTDSVVDAACELIAESHTDQLTMRRLSERLGVALGATYYYVPDRDSLLALVAERINGQISLRSTKPSQWASTLRALMIDYAELYGRYPGMAAFTSSHLAATRPDATRMALLALLLDAGFTEESALNVLATFFFYTSGATTSELMYRDQPGYSAQQLAHKFQQGLDLVIGGARAQLRADRRARH